MASQGWLPPRRSRLRNVACAIGLAAGGLVVLLLGLGWGAPVLSASDGPGSAPAYGDTWTETGDISATWTSTQPVAAIVDEQRFVWPITQHGVTITFYPSVVRGQAWFTFTPKSPSTLGGSYLPTPYFFDLESEYLDSHLPVSLDKNGILIELTYDPSQLGGLDPHTLQFFHLGSIDWVRQGGDVDLIARTLTLNTKRTESFGVGAQPHKQYLYLAFVVRE